MTNRDRGVKQLTIIISFTVLFGLIGCKSNPKIQTYIYEYYNYDAGSLNYVDTLQQVRLPDGSFQALFFKGGFQDSINYLQNDGMIRIINANRRFILYNSSDYNRYDNEYKRDIYTPLLVPSTLFLCSKEYAVENKKYMVYKYLTNLDASESGSAYLTKEFGFLAYVNRPQEYKRLKTVFNLDSEKDGITAIKLTDKLLSDSSFFYYPHMALNRIIFHPPKH